MSLNFEVAKPFSLKKHAHLCERWLQERIADDPSILGLGDLELVTTEKIQARAGRLDILLHDEQRSRRYEVEVMLGATDPNHIIRTIEYWDIERRRYPAYEHVAVLVAEDVTSRFLNVIGLLAGSIPIIAIQLSALEIDGKVFLHFVEVLNQTELRVDDAYESNSGDSAAETDRPSWDAKAGDISMRICDRLLAITNEVTNTPLELKYKKRHVAMAVPGSFFNAGVLWPKKGFVGLSLAVDDNEEWVAKLEELGLDARTRGPSKVIVRVRANDLENYESPLRDVIQHAVELSDIN